MFAFSSSELNISELSAAMSDDRAGAFVCFEGRVRNHNENRAVELLEYEAYEALGVAEAERIIACAKERFDVYEVACVHRVGKLQIGDVAVWIGVLAAHRGDAFDACRYVIDEIKQRLPIWKKEHYVDGQAEWVNCQHLEKASECELEPRAPSCGVRLALALLQALTLAVGSGGSVDAAMETLPPADAQIDVLSVSSKELQQFKIIDIRGRTSIDNKIISRLLHVEPLEMPLNRFDWKKPPLDKKTLYLFVCEDGRQSAEVVTRLRKLGFKNVFYAAGGIEAIRRKFIA